MRVSHRARVFGALRKAAAGIEEGPSGRGRAREVGVDEAELADVGKVVGVLGSIALRLSIEMERERGRGGVTYNLADVWYELSESELYCYHTPQFKTFGCLLGPISTQAFTSSTIGLTIPVSPSGVSTIVPYFPPNHRLFAIQRKLSPTRDVRRQPL